MSLHNVLVIDKETEISENHENWLEIDVDGELSLFINPQKVDKFTVRSLEVSDKDAGELNTAIIHDRLKRILANVLQYAKQTGKVILTEAIKKFLGL